LREAPSISAAPTHSGQPSSQAHDLTTLVGGGGCVLLPLEGDSPATHAESEQRGAHVSYSKTSSLAPASSGIVSNTDSPYSIRRTTPDDSCAALRFLEGHGVVHESHDRAGPGRML
jgi:hypothetical protein